MEDWEEMFAKAEGRAQPSTGKPAEEDQKHPSKRQKGGNDFLQCFLHQRCQRTENHKWPFSSGYFKLGCSMVDDALCQEWKCSEATDAASETLCDSCRGPKYIHELERREKHLKSSHLWIESQSLALQAFSIFQSLRNLRCMGKIIALSSSAEHQPVNTFRVKEECRHLSAASVLPFEKEIRKSSGQLISSLYTTQPLKSKLHRVEHCSKPFSEPPPHKSDWHVASYFDLAIRLIMACDDAYLQLYYMHLTQMFGPVILSGIHGVEAMMEFLPHPTTYFRSAMRENDLRAAQDIIRNADQSSHRAPVGAAQDVFGWDLTPAQEHPLSALHRWHWAESVLLFRSCMSWCSPTDKQHNAPSLWKGFDLRGSAVAKSRTRTSKQIKVDFDEEAHETPAPPLLREWRDTCRDTLCHLYAYATISDGVLGQLKDTLLGLGVTKVLEVGAGTGYLAYLLREHGLAVDSYDIAPTDSDNVTIQNEYHGRTPPFGRVNVLSSNSDRVLGHVSSCQSQALFLCYSPPGTPMAFNTLRDFRKRNGRFLVHVGEFKGLTGSSDFERYLLDEMTIVERLPCLTWVTDASEVTVWVAKRTESQGKPIHPSNPDTAKSLLLVCSNCGRREAVRRCRFLRLLCYCSDECCRAHSNQRGDFFKMSLIDVPQSKLVFGDDRYFINL